MGEKVSCSMDLGGDLAGKYRQTSSSGTEVDPAVAEADLEAVRRDGYVILPDLLTSDELTEIRNEISPLLNKKGRNRFEGHTTQRLYSVLNKTRSCDRIAAHPTFGSHRRGRGAILAVSSGDLLSRRCVRQSGEHSTAGLNVDELMLDNGRDTEHRLRGRWPAHC